MKKFLTLMGVAVLATGMNTAAFADEERVMHYEGAAFETTADAKAGLNERAAEIGTILEAEKLTESNLEKIHEISYSLETAVDKLREDESLNKQAVDDLDEAVQAIHFASEEHEEAKTREWFAKLEPAAGKLDVTEEAAAEGGKKDVYEIVIKDHKFEPAEITVPAGEKIKLLIDNQDATPEEFESHDMNREKIIAGKTKATIFVGPLEPGKYHYFGEFNMDSANGYIIAE